MFNLLLDHPNLLKKTSDDVHDRTFSFILWLKSLKTRVPLRSSFSKIRTFLALKLKLCCFGAKIQIRIEITWKSACKRFKAWTKLSTRCNVSRYFKNIELFWESHRSSYWAYGDHVLLIRNLISFLLIDVDIFIEIQM